MIILVYVVAGLLGVYYGSALFERFVSYDRKRRFQKNYGNPFGRRVMRWLPGWAVIETTGRKSGQPRRIPVGGRRVDDSYWLVAVDPQEAAYVKNIQANPRVRIQLRGRWRDGVAHILDDDDVRKRILTLNPLNGIFISIAGREHLTIRIDLDPVT